MMYAELGSIVYDGYDAHGNALNHMPIMELTNGLSEGAGQHFAIMIQMIDLMRNQLGLNALTEGQTPPERMGKTVAQLSFGASDNALSHITDAFRMLFERVCRQIVQLMQGSINNINQEGLANALGRESARFFSTANVSMRTLGVMITEGPDDKLRLRISQLIDAAIANKEIDPEDAIYIENEENYYRAGMMIKKKRREKEAIRMQHEQNVIKQQGDANTQTGVAVEQQKAKSQMEVLSKERELAIMNSQLKRQEEAEKFMQQLALKKLEIGSDMEQADKDFILEVMKINASYTQARMKQKQAA
jgi:hypothetical protein